MQKYQSKKEKKDLTDPENPKPTLVLAFRISVKKKCFSWVNV
jgi:hypothetical protein